jgi:tetratricopeptide (TPR) repeat protein
MSQSFTDHYGMTISTQQAHAAQCWQEGLDRLLSQNAGPNTKFEEAIALDDGLALAHGGLAFWHMQRAQPAEARTSIEHALACAAGITRRERQQLEIIHLWIQGQGRQALTQLIAHLAEFPRDALLMRLAHLLYNRGCSSVGEANFPVAYLGLLHTSAPYCDDNWAFLAEYAWAHHETGALDEAMRLAQRSLALNPSNAVAAHSVAHVYFERGDAGTGAEILGDWLQGFDSPASSYMHLSWHMVLFELSLGQYHRALERYEHNIRPYVVAKSLATLPDSASFLWRLQLYSGASASTVGTPPETSLAGQPWEEVRALATPMAERPGFAFQVAHAAFALAASDDQEGLTMMLTHLQRTASQGDLCAREMVVPLVQGITDFAQGQYARAAALLEPVCRQLVRIGGSHAQREVFEDTLVEAYLRAEQFDKAEAMLAERLARRASARDTFWLGRAQAGRGQHTQAQGSFATAAQGWRLGDTTSPEMTALHDQYRQTT